MVISRTSGMTTDVDSYMFGSVLAMTWADVALSVVLCAAVLAMFVLFYHKLFAVTFDESFSRATGLRVDRYNTLLAILTALTIVLGMRMMGAMLISSLVIFPALTAMRLFRSFRGVVVCAAVTSVCVLLCGAGRLLDAVHAGGGVGGGGGPGPVSPLLCRRQSPPAVTAAAGSASFSRIRRFFAHLFGKNLPKRACALPAAVV